MITFKTGQLSDAELNILNTMQKNLYASNNKAIIISPKTSSAYLEFTGATAIISEGNAAWLSKSPELPLSVIDMTVQPQHLSISTIIAIFLN